MVNGPDLENLQNRIKTDGATGPGQRLRAAREALGYSPQDVAKRLRLHAVTIDDLEHDTFEEGLALVFVKGYLRAYAQLLNLNPDEIIAEFDSLGFQEDREMPDLATKAKRLRQAQRANRAPVQLQSHPGYFWGAMGVMFLAIFGVVFGYKYQPSIKPATVAVIQQEPDAMDILLAEDPVEPQAAQTSVIKEAVAKDADISLPEPNMEPEQVSLIF